MNYEVLAEASPIGIEKELRLGRQIVNFMGPEGSGKTTMAKRLAVITDKPFITFGDIFRDLAKNDPGPHGDECRALFAEHRYMKPEILFEIISERFKQEDLADGFVVDGAMRTVGEIENFQKMLETSGRVMPLTSVLLRIPGWMGADRIQNAHRNRPTEDSVDGIIGRMSKYYYQLSERVKLIKEQPDWQLLQVNGIGEVDEVFKRVCEALA